MPYFYETNNIVNLIQEVIVSNKTTLDTTPSSVYANIDVSSFKYSTLHDNSYTGIMKK